MFLLRIKADVCWVLDENVACEENPPVWQDVTSQLCPSTCSKYGVVSSFNKKTTSYLLDPLL